ncbi:MAG: Brp/Blh family beta-carotene 15,15'-dioxygenase [Vicingaceae bacterium]
MSTSSFIFIAFFFAFLAAFSGSSTEASELIESACLAATIFLGMPHGAIDNRLYQLENNVSDLLFFSVYIGIILVNILCWIFLPVVGYGLFLMLSAYHFGQSQFSHYFKKETFTHAIFYFIWGSALLSGLIFWNSDEITALISKYPDVASLGLLHNRLAIIIVFFSSHIIFLLFLLRFTGIAQLSTESFFMELITLGIIQLSFFLFPLIVGFSLYFVLLHSMKVMREEFHFLRAKKTIKGSWEFVKILSPLTLLSIIGMCVMVVLIEYSIISMSYLLALLIVFSSITLPHVFVMKRFYEKSSALSKPIRNANEYS